ncbi:hypothetical protein HYH02_007322 [Chlamydomonas schloesseri]|uniref:BTB domain-containing protein n=1 Tax=Chlamydomonas schloesseri TaxID=2026947 RepID=A0A835WI59_9CHLO|nr:hypothetical protein HYH02_007322 [Chlamydomonas schloesseri]|eukprot:KAG2447866.1 hypothetical protein HYH02_007322 [Chlamydomonas schloesseri]
MNGNGGHAAPSERNASDVRQQQGPFHTGVGSSCTQPCCAGAALLPTRAPTSCETRSLTGPPPLPDCDLRLVCSDGSLLANRCVLCRASSVLRASLELELPDPGVLRLPADRAEAWRVALGLLSLEAYPLQLVTLDNVRELLLLADKYDIPVVRGACAHYLHLNAHTLSLAPPLASAGNLLTAASLAARYVLPHPALKAYGASVQARLEAELVPLRRSPEALLAAAEAAAGPGGRDGGAAALMSWQLEVLRLVAALEELAAAADYHNTVAPEVQTVVTMALLAAVRHGATRVPPMCGRCGGVLPSGPGALHADCAAELYTQLHTRGCRLCNTPMPPSHARFCNSCAYRKNKKS